MLRPVIMLLFAIMHQEDLSVSHSLIPRGRNLQRFVFILFSQGSLLVSGPDCATLEQGYIELSGAVPWLSSTPVSASVWS